MMLRSQSMRWPPFLWSYKPRLVTVHQPQLRFLRSLCGAVQTWGLKLNVVKPNGLFVMIFTVFPLSFSKS